MNQDTTRSSRALGSNYVLEREIGGGATGRVWRAIRRADGAAVAVKVLRAEFAGDTDSVVRFLRQRTVLAQVAHPHLVRVHDLVAEGDMLAVVMDLVEGKDLRQVIRSTGGVPLNREDALTILSQVAWALNAVHAAGVVHRDIKPENVLIQGRIGAPHAMLTDFGLAKFLDGPAYTSASVLNGTPAYMAPEVVTGNPAGPESDVYALSIMAYELLAGERPVHAENPAALLLAHLSAEVVRPPGLPDGLWRLISAGLSKEPEARPTAAEFAARIVNPGHESSMASTMDAIRPAPVKPAPPKPNGRKRWLLWTAGALCVLLGVGAGLWFGRPTTKASSQAQVSHSAEPPLYQYVLPVEVTSPKPGEILLKFPSAGKLDGFQSYIVYRDKDPVDQFVAWNEKGYSYLIGDQKTPFCYRVVALLQTDKPPAALEIQPVCQPANGKPRG
ncbi:MAG TPA: serine/threonine-protein kinase [Candidatus Limnocylindrales bacterium]|nr:serine/threonine-protein kinase [Candidatus Limnocylindrales bacterium]